MEIKDKYNTYYIVSLINNEIENYENIISKKQEIKSDLDVIDEMVEILESKDYNLIKSNLILFSTFLPRFFSLLDLGKSKLLKHFDNAVFCCSLLESNPNKYDKEDFQKYESTITGVQNHLNDIYIKKSAEMSNYNQRITLDELIELKRIRSNFKLRRNINGYQYEILKKMFSFYGIKDIELIRFLEVIKTYNNKIHMNNKHFKIDYGKLNEFMNMFSSGFETIKIPYLEDKSKRNQLDNLISSIKQVAAMNLEDSLLMLPSYSGDFIFGGVSTIDEFKYLMESILKYYQKCQLEMIDEIRNLENYENKGYRDLVIKEFRDFIVKYNFFRDFYYSELNKFISDQNDLSEIDDVNVVHYAVSGDNASRCLFERDLSNIAPDRYKEISNLITRFKKDKLKLSETKSLHHAFDELLEIRSDQVRILYKHLKSNEYVILGVFLKKTDNDINQYKRFNDRINNKYVSEDVVVESLNEVLGNKHKGGRLNSL